MKGYSAIVKYKFKAGIILGMMAALAILVTDLSPSASFKPTTDIHTGADQEQGSEEDLPQLTAAKDLVASVSQLTLDQTWHFIADIYSDEVEDQDIGKFEIREYNTWFRTLFRLIISPNAP